MGLMRPVGPMIELFFASPPTALNGGRRSLGTVAFGFDVNGRGGKISKVPALFRLDLDLAGLYVSVSSGPRDCKLDAFIAKVLEFESVWLRAFGQTGARWDAPHGILALLYEYLPPMAAIAALMFPAE